METLLKERLPSNWNYAVTSDGRVFFVDDEFERTTWVHPTWKQAVQSGHLRNPDHPDGVEFDVTEEGVQYFIDHNAASTYWNSPTEKVELRKDAKRSASPLKRISSKRKSLKKSVDVKRNRNSEVIQRGWLHRQEGGLGPLKTWKKRWCVLSDLCLFIYKGPEEGELLGSVLLPSYRIIPGQKDSANKKFIFKAEHENMKSEHFSGETVEEAERWMEAMHLATMAVDGTSTEYKTMMQGPENTTNLKSSNNLHQSFIHEPTQNEQNFINYNENLQSVKNAVDNKHKPIIHEQVLASPEFLNEHRNNFGLQENSTIHERSNLKSHSASEKNHWKKFDALNTFPAANEMLGLEGNNFNRVKEWTEEQNKYRNDMMTPKLFGDTPPYASTPIKELRSDPENWMKREAEELQGLLPTSMEDNNAKGQLDLPENAYQPGNESILHTNNNLDIYSSKQNDVSKVGNNVILSRQSSKTNPGEQHLRDLKDIDPVTMRSSNKSSFSSNASNFVKQSVTSMVVTDAFSRPINADYSSPEPMKKGDIFDVILKNKVHLNESHNILNTLSQRTWQSPTEKGELIQILIHLRRDQTYLHELLYCFTSEEDLLSTAHHQTIKDLNCENSIMINQLENCLYGASSKDDKEMSDQTSNPKEPPKPRKRSTTQATSITSTLESNPLNPLLAMAEDNKAESANCASNPENFYLGQQTIYTSSNYGSAYNKNGLEMLSTNMPQRKLEEKVTSIKDETIKSTDNRLISYKQMKNSIDSCNKTFGEELESTFFETDLDSLQTSNIAKFTYGVTPSDLNKSPAFKKLSVSMETKSAFSKETNCPSDNNNLQQGYYSPTIRQNLFLNHYNQTSADASNVNMNTTPNHIQKKLPMAGKHEFKFSEQYKQTVIPLKSSIGHPNSTAKQLGNEPTGNKEGGLQMLDKQFLEAQQRTHSLSNDDAKEFKHNILRSIKSTQNLNKEKDTDDESQAGFRSRSNIRRLSGIFTPRPFYKSRSTIEVSKIDPSNLSTKRDGICEPDDFVNNQFLKSSRYEPPQSLSTHGVTDHHRRVCGNLSRDQRQP